MSSMYKSVFKTEGVNAVVDDIIKMVRNVADL